MDADTLIRRIDAAFSEASYPQGNFICHECDECFELYDDIKGCTPAELSDRWIEQSFDKLPLLSDEAKRYYLPAYFRVSVHKPDSLVTQFLLYTLADGFRMEPDGGYSAPQKEAIRDFLEYIRPHSDEHNLEYLNQAKTLWKQLP